MYSNDFVGLLHRPFWLYLLSARFSSPGRMSGELLSYPRRRRRHRRGRARVQKL